MNDPIAFNVLADKELIKIFLLVISILVILLIMLVINRNFDKSIKKIQEDLAAIKKSSDVQSTYLSQFNDHFGVVDQKLKTLEEITSITSRDISSMAEGITGEVGVGKAIELARRGATVEEILQSSNLQKDQAELIVKFHGGGA